MLETIFTILYLRFQLEMQFSDVWFEIASTQEVFLIAQLWAVQQIVSYFILEEL